ncbi:MoaD/ThiS family protein [Verrucomicrobium spinosum]|uniref:MoaD/ThiS family protein n=1 Tax=Verrucomicrobium spinosum TaxID=2736 RepID=UPI0001746B55|nr:MoaD/ThiS family protein [Verrucomicrobium spinosum]
MKVRVLYFSVLKDLTGIEEGEVTLTEGATVADLLTHLFQNWPTLQAWDTSLLVAVDQTYAKRDTPLHEDAEVAIMPPVQGG